MRVVKFGRIENCVIRDGEPVFDPAPRVLRDIKLGAADTSRTELTAVAFQLKSQTIELFQHLDQVGTGTVQSLEIRHGLPVRLVVRHPL